MNASYKTVQKNGGINTGKRSSMKTAEILTVSELKAQYAATDYALNPKYYQDGLKRG